MVKEGLVERDGFKFESLGDLVAIAEFQKNNQALFSGEESKRVVTNVGVAVGAAVSELLASERSSGALEEASENCDILHELTSMDLCEEKAKIETAMESALEIEQSEYEPDYDDDRIFKAESTMSVDGMFDALLE